MTNTQTHARKAIALALAITLASGCSTRPRNFAASLATPVADRTTFEQDYRTCQNLVASGRNKDFKAGAAQVLATGAGAVGGGVAVVGLGIGGTLSSAGAAAAAAMPVVGFLAGFGVTRAIRGGKERKYKRLMTSCMAEYGYQIDGWQKLKKRDDAANIAASRVKVEPATASTSPALAQAVDPPN